MKAADHIQQFLSRNGFNQVVDIAPPSRDVVEWLLDTGTISRYLVLSDEDSDELDRLKHRYDCLEVLTGRLFDIFNQMEDTRTLVRFNSNRYPIESFLKTFYPHISEGSAIVITGTAAGGRGTTTVDNSRTESAKNSFLATFCERRNLDYYTVAGQSILHKPYSHLLKYRNKHEGERVFLVGNGPSLNETNLDLIANEHAIAMNRISLLYSETAWRPSYYIYASDNVRNDEWGEDWQRSVNTAVSEAETTSFVWTRYADILENPSNLELLETVTECPTASEGTFSTNAAQWISKTGTSMNIALQLAYYMGFDQIFFIGCDMNWSSTSGTESDPNHFDDEYSAWIPDGEAERRRMRRTYQHANRFFESQTELHNATRETYLDVYPLVDYEDVATDRDWTGTSSDQRTAEILKMRLRMLFYWRFLRYPIWMRNKAKKSFWINAKRAYNRSAFLRTVYRTLKRR